ncbi:MAG TPA: hypothetical protein PKA06_04245, partial [Gemmatales bacterium]|nr:hypothetical protein [Gemmatales bacterium]
RLLCQVQEALGKCSSRVSREGSVGHSLTRNERFLTSGWSSRDAGTDDCFVVHNKPCPSAAHSVTRPP